MPPLLFTAANSRHRHRQGPSEGTWEEGGQRQRPTVGPLHYIPPHTTLISRSALAWNGRTSRWWQKGELKKRERPPLSVVAGYGVTQARGHKLPPCVKPSLTRLVGSPL